MHVIAFKKLREFYGAHPEAEAPLRAWYKVADHAEWRNFGEVKRTCSNSVDQVGSLTVFDIGGNKYRLIVKIEYKWHQIYIRHVLTHADYDRGRWKEDRR